MKLGPALGIWSVIALCGLSTAACGDDDDDGAGGNAGSSGAGSSGNNAGSGAVSLSACAAYCEHYVQACSKPSICAQYCQLVQSAVPQKCAAEYNQFFECGAKASLDCAAALGNTPSAGCGQDEIVACVGGESCNRFSSIDNGCEKAHPGLVGFLCTREDDAGCVPLDATDSESRSRCCPAP
jgi:hypothetical protein